MRRRIRWRRAGKRSGVVALAAIAGVWLASRWWSFSVSLGMQSHVAVLVMRAGQLTAECGPKKPSWTGPPPGLHAQVVATDPSNREWRWGLDWYLPIPMGRANSGLWLVYIPLYIPLAALALPVACLFYADRRAMRQGPGACVRCGYDLTGNTTGVCPECGAGPKLRAQSEKLK